MWIYALKDKLLSLRASIALRNNKTPRSNPSLKVVRSIGIICDIADESIVNDNCKALLKDKNFLPIHTEVICIDNNNDTSTLSTTTSNCISYNDVSVTGKIKNSTIINFINSHFDYLVYMSRNRSSLAKFLLAKSKSRCRVGVYDEETIAFYDFMVKLNDTHDQNITTIFEKIFNYLRLIS